MDSADKNNQDNTFNKKSIRRKKLMIVAGLAAMIMIFAFIFVHFFLASIVRNKIIASVHNSSGGLYNLQMGNFELKFWKGSVYMENVRIIQDTVLLDKLRIQDPASNLSNINVLISKVDISRIWWQNFLFNRSLKVGTVLIDEPVFLFKGYTPPDTIKVGDESFLKLLPGLVASFAGSLRVKELKVEHGELQYNILGSAGLIRQKANDIFLDMKDIEIDTITKKALYTDDVHFSLSNYELVTSDNLYKLHVGKLSGSYADSLLNIESISFVPLDSSKDQKDNYSFFIKNIRNRRIDFSLFFREKKVSLGSMVLESPRIDLTYHLVNDSLNNKNSIKSKGANKDFLQTVLPYIAYTFRMDRFSITNGNFVTNVISSSGSVKQKANNLFLTLDKILIDTVTLQNGNYWQTLEVSLSNYESMLASHNLKINIQTLRAASKDASVHMNDVVLAKLRPSNKGEQFIYKNFTKSINVKGVDYHRLLYGKGISAKLIDVTGMHLEIINDERLSKHPAYNGEMPNEFMRTVPVYLQIDEVSFNKAYLKYMDYSPDVKEPGILTFEDANFVISNFTNDSSLMSVKNPCRIKAHMLVMGKGLLKLDISIPLLIKDFRCSYEGSLGKMDAVYFNSFLEYGGMRLESGNIEAQSFHVTVLNGKANGEMVLVYHDLNAKLVNKKTGRIKRFLSHIGNFILKNQNKEELKKPKTVGIDYSRKFSDGFLSYIWHSISDGIVKSVVKDFFEPLVK